jgi:hypothetical protein
MSATAQICARSAVGALPKSRTAVTGGAYDDDEGRGRADDEQADDLHRELS